MSRLSFVSELATSAEAPALKTPGETAAPAYPGLGKLFLLLTAIGVLTSLRYQFQRPGPWDSAELAFLIACTTCYYPWLGLTPLVFRIERRFPLGSGKWMRNIGVLALISIPICAAGGVLMSYFFTGTLSLLRFSPYPPLAIFWVKHFPIAEILFWSSAAGGYFIRMHSQLRAQERRSAQLALEKSQLEAGLKQAQLEVIRARLNPHFLYNSLQNISAMAKQDPQTASRMLARLGDILRTVLRQDSRPESTLAEEMELAQAYVALEQMRFGDRLKATFNVPPELRPAMVPCFILQPLIENAVIHGLRGIRKTGIIDIAAAKEGDRLVLTVTDNGAGLPEQEPPALKTGFGLGSTAERLSNMYPGAHEFRIERLPAGGTQVRIAIPLRLAGFEDGRLNDE